MCTNDENFPVLIENQIVGDIRPLSPVASQKPATMELDAVHEYAAVPPEFPVEGTVKHPLQSTCNGVIEDVTKAVKDTVGSADVAVNPATQRGDNMSVDPQLHLLDFQLRHILKPSPSAREEGSSAACDAPSMKTKNAVEGSPSRSFAHNRGVMSAATRDPGIPSADQPCSRKPPHSGSVRCELVERQLSGGRSDGIDHWSGTASRARPSRSVERGRRPSYGRKDANEEAVTQPSDERGDGKMLSVDAAGSGGITFGGVEELSHGNVPVEDLPTTNIYLDDHATKAAPYTIASQFYSLGSEADDDAGSEAVPDKKMDEDGTCNVSPSACNMADKPRRPVTLTRPSLSSSERPNEQPPYQQYESVWQRCSSANTQFTTSAIVSRALSINGPITGDAFPRPKFSVRSPSSPARLATGDIVIDAKPRQITVEPADEQGVVGSVLPPRDGTVPAAPLAAQEPDCSDANSVSDVEVGVFTVPSGDKLAALDGPSELRGTADGESPRVPCEVIDGRGGDTVQQSENSDRISSCSAELVGITSCSQRALQMNMFARPTADFPDIAGTAKVVPMAVAKKIADCLDVSLGSDKEVKEIMRNGEAAVDKVNRAISGAPISRFAVVSKTVVGCFESSDKVPNSATAPSEPAAVNIDSISVPKVPDSVPANHSTVYDVRTYSNAARQPCLSAVVHSRHDDVSDTGSSMLVKTETFSSPECLPRPPAGRVSKKAAIANRARYVFVVLVCHTCETLYLPF